MMLGMQLPRQGPRLLVIAALVVVGCGPTDPKQAAGRLSGKGALVNCDAHGDVTAVHVADAGVDSEFWHLLEAIHAFPLLDLRRANITDADMVRIQSLDVGTLDLSHTQVTSQGLAKLLTMPSLRTLYLDGMSIDEPGLTVLKQMTKLRNLSLLDANVESAEYDALNAALPDCVIFK